MEKKQSDIRIGNTLISIGSPDTKRYLNNPYKKRLLIQEILKYEKSGKRRILNSELLVIG